MNCVLWSYVWVVFKSGFKSREGYSGSCTLYNHCFNGSADVLSKLVDPQILKQVTKNNHFIAGIVLPAVV